MARLPSLFRRKTPLAATPAAATPAAATSAAAHNTDVTIQPEQTSSADMAANLSADLLMPETRNLLEKLSDRLGYGSRSSSASDAPSTTRNLDQPPSDGMLNLLRDLSKKLFPHRHNTDDTAVDTSVLLKKLKDDLSALTPKPITDITPSQPDTPDLPSPDLDPTAQDIMARANLEANLDSNLDSGLDADAAATDTQTSTSSNIGGDTKPDHASKEALSNPFSLVNINRGAASSMPITPAADAADIAETPKKRSRRKQQAERATINYKKKLVQTRFSRRRFLREYRSTTIVATIFSFLLLIGFTVGTIFTNVSFVIPQTRINQDAAKQSEAFRNEIDRNQPKLSGLLQRRQELEEKLQTLTDNFVNVNQIRDDFTNFLNILDEDPRVEVSQQTIEAVENELPNIEAINVSFRIKTSFLLWLKYRNQMIREYDDINVIEETITAPPGVPSVDIYIKMSRPGRSS